MGHISRYSSFAAIIVMARSDKGHCMWVSTRPLTVGTETLPRILMPVVVVSEILIGYICIGFFASFLPHLCTGLSAVTFQLVTVIWLSQLLIEDLFWLKTQVHSQCWVWAGYWQYPCFMTARLNKWKELEPSLALLKQVPASLAVSQLHYGHL